MLDCNAYKGMSDVRKEDQPRAGRLTTCAIFVSFSFSLLSGLSHQDYSSIPLSLPQPVAKGYVLSLLSGVPPSPAEKAPLPLPQLSHQSAVRPRAAGTFGLLIFVLPGFPSCSFWHYLFLLLNPMLATFPH